MKLKHIVAAAAMVAAAAPAFATISQPSTGNGELFAVVLDRVDQVSYLVDLGLSMDAGVAGATVFDGSTNFSLALNTSNFSAFQAAAGATSNPFEFAVLAGDAVGSTAASPKRLYSTVSTATTTLGNGLLTNTVNNLGGFANYQALEATGQTHTTLDNGDGWAAVGSNAYFLTQSMDSFNGVTTSQGWVNTNAEGTAAAFRKFATSSTSGGAATVQSTFAGVWTLDQTTPGSYTLNYTVAAVPEADGLVLLAVGIAAMGFVGRRRQGL
jgi:hypothetical protein